MIRIRRCHPHIETAAPTTRSPHDPSWKFNDRFNRSPTPAHPRRSRTNHPSRSRAPRPPKRSSPSQPHEGGESRRLRPKDRSRRNCAPLLPGVATVPPETELRTRIDQPSPRRTTRLGVKGHNTSRLAAQIIPFDPDATPPAILPTPVSLYPPRRTSEPVHLPPTPHASPPRSSSSAQPPRRQHRPPTIPCPCTPSRRTPEPIYLAATPHARPDHPLQLDCLAVSYPANARVPVPPTTPLLGAGLPRCNTSRLAAQIPPAAPRSQTAARLWLPLQTLQTSICQTVFRQLCFLRFKWTPLLLPSFLETSSCQTSQTSSQRTVFPCGPCRLHIVSCSSKLASIYPSKIPQFKTNFHTSFVSV
jgi:hypothetical protein